MGLFDDLKAKAAIDRLGEEALYSAALKEMENGLRRDGLWAKALEESKFNEPEAKALYLRLRVQSMRDELILSNMEKQRIETTPISTPPKLSPLKVDIGHRKRTKTIDIPQSSKHTDQVYSCNNCNYSGKLLLVKTSFFTRETMVCPVCGNRR